MFLKILYMRRGNINKSEGLRGSSGLSFVFNNNVQGSVDRFQRFLESQQIVM